MRVKLSIGFCSLACLYLVCRQPVDSAPPEFSAAVTVVPAYANVTEPSTLPADASPAEEVAIVNSQVVPGDAFVTMLDFIRRSVEAGRKLSGYTATLEQQAQIDGVLRELDMMDLKLRREPFSVYLKWHRDQQEVLFVDGENDNCILVHPTRGLLAFRSVWKLRPVSPQAMRDTRYPITELGVERLGERTLRFHEERDFFRDDLTCTLRSGSFEGKPVTRFDVSFESPARSEEYSNSHLMFDRANGLLIGMENYGWDGDQPSGKLLEKYIYHGLAAVNDLNDQDFSWQNPDYHFE